METTVHSINLITSNPKVRRGQPCLAGTGLRVADIVIVMQYHHQDPQGIAEWYGIGLPEVHAALAYYYLHQEQIDADIRHQIETDERLIQEHLANGGTTILP